MYGKVTLTSAKRGNGGPSCRPSIPSSLAMYNLSYLSPLALADLCHPQPLQASVGSLTWLIMSLQKPWAAPGAHHVIACMHPALTGSLKITESVC